MEVFLKSLPAQIANGIIVGAIYGLIGLSMLLISNVMKLVDLLRGDLAITGAYLCFWLSALCGFPFAVSITLAVPLTGVLGLVVERSVYRPLARRSHYAPLVAALGLSIAIQGALQLLFGPEMIGFEQTPPLLPKVAEWGLIRLSRLDVILVLSFVLLTSLLHYFLTRTRLGLGLLAVADDEEASYSCGIARNKVYSFSFFVASSIAGIVGILYGLQYGLEPGAGFGLTIRAFIIASLAGSRGVLGAAIAGLALGVVESVCTGLLGANYRDSYTFLVLLVLLWIWPEGLFGRIQKRYARI